MMIIIIIRIVFCTSIFMILRECKNWKKLYTLNAIYVVLDKNVPNT